MEERDPSAAHMAQYTVRLIYNLSGDEAAEVGIFAFHEGHVEQRETSPRQP